MVVLMAGRRHTFAILLFTFVQQLRQTAAAAEVDAELIEQATVEEVVLLCHWRWECEGERTKSYLAVEWRSHSWASRPGLPAHSSRPILGLLEKANEDIPHRAE